MLSVMKTLCGFLLLGAAGYFFYTAPLREMAVIVLLLLVFPELLTKVRTEISGYFSGIGEGAPGAPLMNLSVPPKDCSNSL